MSVAELERGGRPSLGCLGGTSPELTREAARDPLRQSGAGRRPTGGVARLARGRSRTRPIVFGSDCCDHFRRPRAGSLSMRGFWPRATGVITALIVAYGFASASANPLTPFRYKSQAQRHCPADVIVWLDLGKGIYYSKRQRRYGRGFYRKFYVPGGSSQQRLSPLVARAAIRIRPNELRHDPLLKAVAASGGPPEAIFSSRSGSRTS